MSHKKILLQALTEIGWLLNLEKRQLSPTQHMVYLGAMFNTQNSTVSLPPLKGEIIIRKILRVIQSLHLTVSQFLNFIGMMSSCILLILWAHWHLRYFQFLVQWKKQCLSQSILLTSVMHSSLHLWTNSENLFRPQHLGSLSWTIVTPDTSGQGWGAHCGEVRVQGRWSFPTKGVVSNIQEMRAAFLALTLLIPQIRGQ